MAVIWMKVQSGFYVRTLCKHIGILLGVGGQMAELRRTKSGLLGERDSLYTMHDILDAQHLYNTTSNEEYLRKIVMPLERLLMHYPKIVIKDSAVSAVCHGARLLIPGVLRYSNDIKLNHDVVIVTTKGEAVAIGTALMTVSEIFSCDHGFVAKVKRVIMDKGLYPKRWGMGVRAKWKKDLIK